MKTFKPYPRYRPSGILWIGDVPEQWDKKRLGVVCLLNPSKSEISGLPLDTKVGFIPMELLGENGELDVDEVRDLGVVYQGFTYCRDGDVIVAKITPCFENGKGALCIGLKNGIGMGTTELHVLRPQEINGRYLYWITRQNAFREIGATEMRGSAGQQRVPIEFIKNWVIGLPSDEEQLNIAAFLDHTTAQLDDLIAQKQRLIELLKEKRQALITQAVTKGLNPKVKMKDSGVAWLGQIPEHWKVKKLQYLKSEALMYGANESAEDDDRNLPRFLRITDLNSDGTLKDDTFKSLPVVVAKPYLLNDGDMLLARTGATVGKAVRYRSSWGMCCFAGYLIRFRPDANQLNSVYFEYYTQSQAYWTEIYLSAIQATIQNVSAEKYSGFLVPVPPVNEQSEICEYLVNATSRLDLLARQTEDSVERLGEYRQSLISAAVTGKIDLRNWKSA